MQSVINNNHGILARSSLEEHQQRLDQTRLREVLDLVLARVDHLQVDLAQIVRLASDTALVDKRQRNVHFEMAVFVLKVTIRKLWPEL